jgi:hypothetical protein
MNKIKPNQNIALSQAPTSSKIFSSLLRFNSGARNDNGINLNNYMTNYSSNEKKGIFDLRRTLEPKITEVEETLEKKLEQDILNLLNNLLHLPGVIKYMEKIIHTLCYYMEAVQSSQNDIMNIFIKMLDNFQDEFIVFFPYVLNFSKNIGISSLNYFKEFRYGLEKVDIMSLIAKENLNPKTVLSNIGNINNNDNNNSNNIKENNDSNNNSNNNDSPDIKVSKVAGSLGTLKSKPTITPKTSKRNSTIINTGLNREIVTGTIESLIKEFDTQNCLSEEDWHEWFKNTTKKLFEQSPSYIIFSCHKNNVYDPQVINELYNSAFYSLWKICSNKLKLRLSKYLQIILKNEKTPKDILLTILNLIEFINKEENEMFEIVEYEELGKISDVCRTYAKAVYYIENQYINNDSSDELKKLINL